MKPHNAESLTSCSVAMVRRHKVCCTPLLPAQGDYVEVLGEEI